MTKKAAMQCVWILALLTLATNPTLVCAERLDGDPFTDHAFVWQSVPSGWVERPVTHQAEAQHADLAISLEQQLYPYLLPLIDEYAKKHALNIVTTKGTCEISADLLFRKAIDVGGFCCAPAGTDRLPGLRFHTLAIAAIALLVHPENPLEDMTLSEARDLFRGKITDWSTFVAPSTPAVKRTVHPIGRFDSKRRPGHWRLLLDNEELFSPNVLEVGAIEDMVRSVAADPQAIGYETLWMAHRYRATGAVKTLRLSGASPDDPEALAQGRYPLYRVYNITTWEGAAGNPQAKALVGYLLNRVEQADSQFFMVPASRLRASGWQFEGDELVGEPVSSGLCRPSQLFARELPTFDSYLTP